MFQCLLRYVYGQHTKKLEECLRMLISDNPILYLVGKKIWNKLVDDTEDFENVQFEEMYNSLITWHTPENIFNGLSYSLKHENKLLFLNSKSVVKTKINDKTYFQKHFRKTEVENILIKIKKEIDKYKDKENFILYNIGVVRDSWYQYRQMYKKVYSKYKHGELENMDGEPKWEEGMIAKESMQWYDNGFNSFYNYFITLLDETTELLYFRLYYDVYNTMLDEINKCKDTTRKSFTEYRINKIIDNCAKELTKTLVENKEVRIDFENIKKTPRKKVNRPKKEKKVIHMTEEEYEEKYGGPLPEGIF